jgi:hypothetical protein
MIDPDDEDRIEVPGVRTVNDEPICLTCFTCVECGVTLDLCECAAIDDNEDAWTQCADYYNCGGCCDAGEELLG